MLALAVLVSACRKDETISGYTDPGAVYHLQAIDGTAFAAGTTIGFPGKGRIAGQGPCSGYSARQSLPLPWFRVETLVATRGTCADVAAESMFFETLQAMSLAEVAGDVLILSNDAGTEMLFRAAGD